MFTYAASGSRRREGVLFAIITLSAVLACGKTAPAAPIQIEGPKATATLQAQPSPMTHEVFPPGDSTRSISYGGVERTYLLHVPGAYDGTRPVPLVLALHGIGLDASEMARISGLSAQADASGFVVAYPNGTGLQKSWNGGHCCGEAAKNNVDDVGFVRALIDELATLLSIDPARVYVTGFSNGAIMAYRLACQLSDRVAAVAPVSATQIREDQQACQPGRSVSVIHFHGTADRLNPYNGGTTAAGFQFVPVEEAMGFWAGRNECPGQPKRSEAGKVRHEVLGPCSQNSTVELYTITDGEHAWPGGEAVNPQVGEPTHEISATPLMWEFFAAHPMP